MSINGLVEFFGMSVLFGCGMMIGILLAYVLVGKYANKIIVKSMMNTSRDILENN